jgi:hypothetical protein
VNYQLKAIIAKLRKNMSNEIKGMLDTRVVAEKTWKNSVIDTPKERYILDQRIEAIERTIAKQGEVMDLLMSAIEQALSMQAHQSIDIAKVKNRKVKVKITTTVEPTQAQVDDNDHIVVMYKREDYMMGSRIHWYSPGFVPREIAFNEFDIARREDATFNIFDSSHIKKRWLTLFQQCKPVTGITLGQLVRLYAEKRGLKK